ncbi:hypothetical protein BDB00DRAFT_852979 [Zychaea mexicana]|uniref:uncharacterized protein n=1 Tax=Zychaea mexicana TaxID=64656 RepID=UPI0022FEDBFC|nr:uncharacterized protein BDB00DRAFT_852979 [Zychaea mexicana]KAI9484879.1 hypothetical protein BDB00DRAFT_852979 [Zychaea mexicana]
MPIQPPAFSARRLLGMPPNAEAIHDYLNTLSSEPLPEPVIKRFPDSTYYSYKSLGLSLSFTPTRKGSDKLLLDSIDIYNGHTRDGFQPFVGKEYPYGFTPQTQAHEIVSQLGEPDRKGGGGTTRLPCWIEYQFEDEGNDNKDGDRGKSQGGLMLQLHGVEWEDRDMGWTSLVLF